MVGRISSKGDDLEIPLDFLAAQNVQLSWGDVRYGLLEKLVSSETIIALAKDSEKGMLPLSAELNSEADVLEQVHDLADIDSYGESDSRKLWLYLVLLWGFSERNGLEDPLAFVEHVYGRFDYPSSIEPFVRYMPMVGDDLGSLEANESRMIQRWAEYLTKESEEIRRCRS